MREELGAGAAGLRDLTKEEIGMVAGGADFTADENGLVWLPSWTYVGSDYMLVHNAFKQDPDTGRLIPTDLWKPAGGEPNSVDG